MIEIYILLWIITKYIAQGSHCNFSSSKLKLQTLTHLQTKLPSKHFQKGVNFWQPVRLLDQYRNPIFKIQINQLRKSAGHWMKHHFNPWYVLTEINFKVDHFVAVINWTMSESTKAFLRQIWQVTPVCWEPGLF